MKKKLITTLVAAMIAASLAGCNVTTSTSGSSSESYAVSTVNGMTQGYQEKETSDKGSASFKVDGYHVDMTNFSFDADESGKVEAEISEDGLVCAKVYVNSEDGEPWQQVVDGHYPETFTQEAIADQMNNIYQNAFNATDAPITEDVVGVNGDVMSVSINLNNGYAIIMTKEGSDEYILFSTTTDEHNTDEILQNAMIAMGLEG